MSIFSSISKEDIDFIFLDSQNLKKYLLKNLELNKYKLSHWTIDFNCIYSTTKKEHMYSIGVDLIYKIRIGKIKRHKLFSINRSSEIAIFDFPGMGSRASLRNLFKDLTRERMIIILTDVQSKIRDEKIEKILNI